MMMVGKRTIPDKVHKRIRKMHAAGHSAQDTIRTVKCSRYTYRVALDPEYREREAQRHRDNYPGRHSDRKANSENYMQYRASYFSSDDYRAAVRERMRMLREQRKASHE